jgi:cytochrome c oxidase subunit 2
MLTPAIACALLEGVAHAESFLKGRPKDVSLDGHLIDGLFDMTTVMVTILFIIMVAIMAIATFVHSDKDPARKANYSHGDTKKHLMRTALIGGAVFFIVDGTLLVNSFIDLNEHIWNWPKDPSTVQIEIFAQQWGWNIRYAGADGKFNTADDVVKFNEMAIPTGAPIFVKLRSKDVIHSFYLPNLRAKQDIVPGQITQLWFQATETGEFEIGCAQHCGVNHYKMRGHLSVLSPADYAEWLKQGAADSARRFDPGDAESHWGWDWES